MKFCFLLGLSLLLLLTQGASAQVSVTDTLWNAAGDSLLDIYRYQLPSDYNEGTPAPLLVGWHQWGSNQNEFFYTPFSSEADQRGWIALSAWGGHGTNWTNQDTQEWMVRIIEHLSTEIAIDLNRIYMVGGSMGGASGMIFANNHLDPAHPMVAATASASGILDDIRRFHEQGFNNSMNEVFQGTPEEVPFTYQRNSAIYFADSLQSMHTNLMHIPVYLTYGNTETYHQYHALDLDSVLTAIHHPAHYIGTHIAGHGWGVFDVPHVCDWLSQFSLVDNPDSLYITADEPSDNYWTGVIPDSTGQFAGYTVQRNIYLEVGWNLLRHDYRIQGVRNVSELTVTCSPPPGYMVVNYVDIRMIETDQEIRLHFVPPDGIADDVIAYHRGELYHLPYHPDDTLSFPMMSGDSLILDGNNEMVQSPPEPAPRRQCTVSPNGNGRYTIQWTGMPASIVVYNILGERIHSVDHALPPFTLSLNDQASGIYLLRMESGGKSYHNRILHLKH